MDVPTTSGRAGAQGSPSGSLAGQVFGESGTLRRNDHHVIAWRRWVPAGQPRASIVVIHGLGEHAGRYGEVAETLARAGFALTAMDLEGFGGSSGQRGDVRYEPTCDDVDRIIADERARTGGLPVFLYGHSLGGLYAFLYAIDRTEDVAGLVLTGPAFDSELRHQPLKIAVARAVARIYPTLPLRNGLKFERVNRSSDVIAGRESDPMVHGLVTARFAIDTLAQMERVMSAAPHLDVPLLVLHGDEDMINPIAASREVVKRVPGGVLTTYPGAFHGLEEEAEGPTMLRDVVAWLDRVLRQKKPED